MWRIVRWAATCAAAALLWAGCARDPGAVAAPEPSVALERARLRPTPDPVRARVRVQVDAPGMDLAGSTGGVLIVDRPGRGHLAVLGPLGSPLATVTSDGTALAVALPRERRLLSSRAASEVVEQATGGALHLDDLVGLTLGDVPLDGARVRSRRPRPDGSVEVVLAAPGGTRVHVVLDPDTGTPRALDGRDRVGRTLFSATFDPFEARDDGTFVPTRVRWSVPALAITADLRFKSWEILDEVPPVFDTTTPAGWTESPLAAVLAPPGAKPVP